MMLADELESTLDALHITDDRFYMILLNRDSPIWLNLIYVVEGGVLRILTQAVLKNIEPFSFLKVFSKPPQNPHFYQTGFHELISREWLNRMI